MSPATFLTFTWIIFKSKSVYFCTFSFKFFSSINVILNCWVCSSIGWPLIRFNLPCVSGILHWTRPFLQGTRTTRGHVNLSPSFMKKIIFRLTLIYRLTVLVLQIYYSTSNRDLTYRLSFFLINKTLALVVFYGCIWCTHVTV